MSDDEESFIILDGSPSMEPSQPNSTFSSLEKSQMEALNSATAANKENQNSLNSLESGPKSQKSSTTGSQQIQRSVLGASTVSCDGGTMMNSSMKKASAENSLNSVASGGDKSLAASFLMGEIGADVLKTSVYSQFPSLCSMEACAEDMVKLQNLMTEYIDLKNTLSKVNGTMKQFYTKTTQWKEDMARMERQYEQQLQDCQTQIATLRNENIELKRQMDTNTAHARLAEEEHLKEHRELIQGISEKTSQIEAMRVQLEKLEQQQLASFEYLPRHENDTKEKPDYVPRPEHERVVKDFERQMSAMLAENLDLKDVQKQYIDEVNCLKVNCTAAEELIKQLRADVSMLQAKDMEKTAAFMEYDSERNKMREEMELLRQQVEVYSKDFVIERDARQNLAGEKDQLLQDLRSLQRKNQELIEHEQKRLQLMGPPRGGSPLTGPAAASSSAASSSSSAASSSSSAATQTQSAAASSPRRTPTPPRVEAFSCPICGKSFKALAEVNLHANICLDQSG